MEQMAAIHREAQQWDMLYEYVLHILGTLNRNLLSDAEGKVQALQRGIARAGE
ncbi:MAG: hypothetical protein RMJ83_03725 [Armatimonadota bacterium]|nr:hypothetical protein [Armatimonadota bacterium]